MLSEKLEQARAGEEADMRVVEEPCWPVRKLTVQQLGDHARVPDIRDRQENPATRREQRGELVQDARRVAQVLEDVRADDRVVARRRKMFRQDGALEVQLEQGPVMGAGKGGGLRFELDTVADAFFVLSKIRAELAGSRPQVEHGRPASDQAGDRGERVFTFQVGLPVVAEGSIGARHRRVLYGVRRRGSSKDGEQELRLRGPRPAALTDDGALRGRARSRVTGRMHLCCRRN